MDHNHTNGSTTPSGQPLTNGGIGGDVGVAKAIDKLNGDKSGMYRIFSPENREYYRFTSNDTPWILKGVIVKGERK